jgi:hypothetical protein
VHGAGDGSGGAVESNLHSLKSVSRSGAFRLS